MCFQASCFEELRQRYILNAAVEIFCKNTDHKSIELPAFLYNLIVNYLFVGPPNSLANFLGI